MNLVVTYERFDAVGIVTMNRPERRNALSLNMISELRRSLKKASEERGVRALVLAAAGKTYSSGHDLTEMRGRMLDEYRQVFDLCTQLMMEIQAFPQPVIAEVQGLATAAGCQLVATCDLVVASEEAGFATPGVKIGLFCSTPMVALTRAVGRKRSLEMLLTGRIVPAWEAAQWGLVNRVVPPEDLRFATLALAVEVAGASESTVTLGKHAFYTQIDMEQGRAYGYAKEVMSMNAADESAQEGIAAFLEKRKAVWPTGDRT